ncbi:hypothetical protein [Lysobacter xanthus]
MRHLLALLLAIAPFARAAPAAPGPLSMFEGASQGHGTLQIGVGRPREFTVDSRGHRDADGTLRLRQTIRMAGEPPRMRDWVLRPAAAPGHYTFTLSDATGPGVAVVDGSRLTLRYAPRRGLRLRQVLDLAADGRTLANRGRITLLGLPIGRLDETIVRVDAP